MAPAAGRSATRDRERATGWPKALHVEGLFRESAPRHIEFRTRDRVTILTGPNGSGKTRLLSILRAVLAYAWEDVARQPFDELTMSFSSGRTLRVGRTEDDGTVDLTLFVERARKTLATCSLRLIADPAGGLRLPTFIHRVGESLWEDTRDGELLELDELHARFPRAPRRVRESAIEYRTVVEQPPDGLAAVRAALGRCPAPTFVRTQRLDVEQGRRARPGRPARREGRIHEYVEQIQTQVEAARADYSRIAQLADSQFASRALDKSGGEPLAISDLKAQFDELADLHRELLSTGLVAETPGVTMGGGSVTKAERRFLAVFLEDWRRKLRPLLPVHEKLQMLQTIVGEKLNSKRLRLDENGRLLVEALDRTEIPVDELSSGEQHLLALFAMLLFSASRGSVVLIDEPEISLHAEWKHAFLDDIRKVSETADLHLVLATHSTGIINGQWDLVETL